MKHDQCMKSPKASSMAGQPTRRILYLGYPLIATPFAEQDTSCRGVREDVATDWLAAVSTGEEGAGTRIALDLVGLYGRTLSARPLVRQ
jgi:hypothetical protein